MSKKLEKRKKTRCTSTHECTTSFLSILNHFNSARFMITFRITLKSINTSMSKATM